MSKRLHRLGSLLVAIAIVAGCATGQAVRKADSAATKGDWDTAVVFYKQALDHAPERADLKIKLERSIHSASAAHVKRARDLEAQEQFAGAIAEYRAAADLDPASTLALTKALELERRMRDQAEAARPRPRVDTLRQQAAQSSPIPHLDPRTPLPKIQFSNAAIRDILKTVGDLTGINIQYDQGLDASLSRPYSMDPQGMPLEDVLNQVLQSNTLAFKVVNARTIFVYQDNAAKRQQFEDQYIQTFFLSNADPAELQTQLNQLLSSTNIPVRPVYTPNKAANALTVKATAPVMAVVEQFVRSMDRGIPEVLIEAEILEVDRNFVRQLGLDLNQWALGLAFSPEVAPAATAGAFPPANPPSYNLNTISHGVSTNDFYATTPAAMIRLLESNTNTRILARPSQRGQAGKQISLKLGDNIPIPTTVFQSGAAGGLANIPTTSVQYQSVGVNLLFTPRVTYQDEIVLDALTLEKSGLGANLDVGGQSFPTIVSRTANTTIRLRDGESTVISGLLRDEDTKTQKSFPGLTGLPVLRQIFGNSDHTISQTDIVMIITPHIVRGHEMTAEDLKPMYIGTGQNVGAGSTPTLISPSLLATPAIAPAASPAPAAPPVAPQAPPQGPGAELAPITPGPQASASPAATRSAAIVPIQPVSANASAPAAAPPAAGGRITLTAPSTGPEGGVQAGAGPYTLPIQISGVTDVATIALTITYDPSVITNPTVTQGSFMMQGGAMVTFVPSVNAAAGRIDLALSRPTAKQGASGSGLLAAIAFTAARVGVSEFTVSGVATTPAGQAIPLQFSPTRVTVK